MIETPISLRYLKNPVFTSLRTAKQEAIQNIDFKWIASGYRPTNDVFKSL